MSELNCHPDNDPVAELEIIARESAEITAPERKLGQISLDPYFDVSNDLNTKTDSILE